MKSLEAFENKQGICYIPENEDEVYTHQDFMIIVEEVFRKHGFEGDKEKMARVIFDQCTWQHPTTIVDELEREDEFEEYPQTYGITNL